MSLYDPCDQPGQTTQPTVSDCSEAISHQMEALTLVLSTVVQQVQYAISQQTNLINQVIQSSQQSVVNNYNGNLPALNDVIAQIASFVSASIAENQVQINALLQSARITQETLNAVLNNQVVSHVENINNAPVYISTYNVDEGDQFHDDHSTSTTSNVTNYYGEPTRPTAPEPPAIPPTIPPAKPEPPRPPFPIPPFPPAEITIVASADAYSSAVADSIASLEAMISNIVSAESQSLADSVSESFSAAAAEISSIISIEETHPVNDVSVTVKVPDYVRNELKQSQEQTVMVESAKDKEQVGDDFPVDLDQPLAFKLGSDANAWRARAIAFYGIDFAAYQSSSTMKALEDMSKERRSL